MQAAYDLIRLLVEAGNAPIHLQRREVSDSLAGGLFVLMRYLEDESSEEHTYGEGDQRTTYLRVRYQVAAVVDGDDPAEAVEFQREVLDPALDASGAAAPADWSTQYPGWQWLGSHRVRPLIGRSAIRSGASGRGWRNYRGGEYEIVLQHG